MNKVLVTGATGFVGRYLCEFLAKRGLTVVGVARSLPSKRETLDYALHAVGDISKGVDWEPIMSGVDCVVHLAARVHVRNEQERDPLTAFRQVNVAGTEQLLRSNGMRGVKRFIYLSTVKVHGDTNLERPFRANDTLEPLGPYARSKQEAERVVREIDEHNGLETVIIRPPLVYGPGVSGNFLRLMKMVDRGIPLPFALIDNSRSLASVTNLCDLIRECLVNPSAAGQQFLVSDNSDVATPELIRLIASAMHKPARLMPVPAAILTLTAKLVGRSAEMSRLIGSLQVDIEETMQTLNWRPPVSLADGIHATVTWYREQKADA